MLQESIVRCLLAAATLEELLGDTERKLGFSWMREDRKSVALMGSDEGYREGVAIGDKWEIRIDNKTFYLEYIIIH